MALGVIYCIIGLAVLGFASDRLVVHAGQIATRFNISQVIIGAVIVGFGTSAPELAVSGWAAASGDVDLGVGNIIGSNVANVTLVLGVAALITPVPVRRQQIYRELPACLTSVVVFAMLVQDGLSRIEGVILFVALVVVMLSLYAREFLAVLRPGSASGVSDFEAALKWLNDESSGPRFGTADIEKADSEADAESVPSPEEFTDEEFSAAEPADTDAAVSTKSDWKKVLTHGFGSKSGKLEEYSLASDVVWLLVGILGTVGGAQLLVAGAERIADELDLGSGFVGLTVVAVGTSLPELVTAAAASRRGMNQLLVGNVLGSNIFNCLAVGGLVGVLGNSGLEDSNLSSIATFIMVGMMFWMAIAATTRQKISRWESALLLASWFVSMPFIIS